MTYGLYPSGGAVFGQMPQYFPGSTAAGANPMLEQSWGQMQSGGQQAADFANTMGGMFQNAFQNPYMVDPNNMPSTSAQQIGAGPQVQGSYVQGPMVGQGMQVQPGMVSGLPQIQASEIAGTGERATADQVGNVPQVGLAGMDMFNNPYLQNSIQAGMDQNNLNFDRNVLTNLDQSAIGAGASGGSRHGLAQGLAMSDLNQQNLNMASQMNERAYNQGMSNFLGQRGQDLGAQTTNAANNLQSQLANQGANLQAMGLNMGDTLQRALANQSTGMQGQLANQGNWLDMMQGNQQAGLQGQLANQGDLLSRNLANQSTAMQGYMANQNMDMQGQLANQQQWGQNQRSNQQYDLASQLANQSNWLSGMQGNQDYMSSLVGKIPSMMSGYGNAMMMPGAMMNSAGMQQQQMAQNQLDSEVQRWMWQQQMPWNQVNNYGNVLTQGAGMAAGGTPAQVPNYSGAFGSLGYGLGDMIAGNG